ncbi:hypothetical protein ACHQM5_002780 [Ranunculus cassubicifolius]
MSEKKSYDDIPRSITAEKLNDTNYLEWKHGVDVYLRGRKKLSYLTTDPPKKEDSKYEDWMCDDSIVMGWLWHSMEPHIAKTVAFLA